MKIAVNPTGIPGVIHQNLRDIYIYIYKKKKQKQKKSSVSVRSLMKTLVDAPIK